MKRLTKRSKDGKRFTAEAVAKEAEGECFFGEAIDRLAAFEDFRERLEDRKSAIPGELEALRAAGKDKTVKFRELLVEKLVTETILMKLDLIGLK